MSRPRRSAGVDLTNLYNVKAHLLCFVGDSDGLEAVLTSDPAYINSKFDFSVVALVSQKELALKSSGKWTPPPQSDCQSTVNFVREGIKRFLQTGDLNSMNLEQRWCLQEYWKDSTLLHYAALGDQNKLSKTC